MAQKIVCPNCKKVIYSTENTCPNCGIAITDEIRRKNKVSLSGCLFTVFVIIVSFNLLFGEDNKKKTEENAAQPQTSQSMPVQAPEITLPGTPLDFILLNNYKVIKRPTTGRHRLEMTILPKIEPGKGQENFAQADLISTVMHVADEAYKRTGVPVIEVNMLAQNTGNVWADKQLAFIVFIPDKKGYDGKQEIGIWDKAMACERGFTADELTYLQLWGKLRTKYLDPETGVIPLEEEDTLDAEIAKIMGKKLKENPFFNIMWLVEGLE